MKYLKILALLAFAIGVNALSPVILSGMPDGGNAFWILLLFVGFGWALTEFSKGTILPSFAWMVPAGIILHVALNPLAGQKDFVVGLCTILAVIILRSGGDEVERRHFAKILWPTVSIAVIGYFVTFFVTLYLALLVGIDGKTAALLSAIVGSTDPAALIPTFKSVVFKPQHKKLVDISVAESAINDAVGAIFTLAVIIMIGAGADVSTVGNVLLGVMEPHNMMHLGREIAIGGVAGCIGWFLMYLYQKHKSKTPEESHDFGAVLAVTIFSYLVAYYFKGNGLLAAFITGLLADYNHGNHRFSKTLGVTEIQIDSLAKPVIFMMAGVFISGSDLWQNALMGLVISMMFIFVARPIAVLLSVGYFVIRKKMTFKEMCFLFVVRETGVIPIVLAVTAVTQFQDLKTLMPLVAWVVIWTLTLLPAITPWWAKTLGLTEEREGEFSKPQSLGFGDRILNFVNNPKNFQWKLGFRLKKDWSRTQDLD